MVKTFLVVKLLLQQLLKLLQMIKVN